MSLKRSEQAARARESWQRSVRTVQASTKKLKDALSRSISAVGSLFEVWDTNGDGTITPAEFRQAVQAMGVDVPPAVCDLVFKVRPAAMQTSCLGRSSRAVLLAPATAGV
jgi:hypothetical protein